MYTEYLRYCKIFIYLGLAIFPVNSIAESLTADQIIDKANKVYSGDDSVSRLTFRFHEKNEQERKLVYSMIWKKYAADSDIHEKMIFFKEFPSKDKDVSFMMWIYKPEINHDDDQWLYLPDLRHVRKVTKQITSDSGSHRRRGHRHDNKDEFAKSVLHRPHLTIRPSRLDKNRILKEDSVGDSKFYVIERTPVNQDNDFPYQKTVNWINKDTYLLERVEYFDMNDTVILKQKFFWKKSKNAWVWTRVEGIDLLTDNQTILDISDIRVNVNIRDKVFSNRSMKHGFTSLRL
ncbi:MAG: outer membrane lipoprotein-sorting protein [Gammaproteobacteria bacterium]